MPFVEVAAGITFVLAMLSFSLTDTAALTLSTSLYVLYVFLFLVTICVNSSELRLGTFYRESSLESRRQQHFAAAFLGFLLLVNVVVVSVQFSLQIMMEETQHGNRYASFGYAASAYRTLQAIFFIFNLLYVTFSIKRENEVIKPETNCSSSYGVFLSTLFSAMVQVCATILAAVQFYAESPLFPTWLFATQILFVSWSIGYDYFLTMGLLPRRCRESCVAHESVIVSPNGVTLPRERLISDM